MAKFKTLSGKLNSIPCDILNESSKDYIIRFKNGAVRNVPKYMVYDMNHLDEGVLDAIRSAAGKVKDFVWEVIKKGRFLLFKDDSGLINVVPPINIMTLATVRDGLGFIPDDDIRKMAEHYDIPVEETVEYDDESVDEDSKWAHVPFKDFMRLCNESIDESFVNEDYDEEWPDEDSDHPFIYRKAKKDDPQYPYINATKAISLMFQEYIKTQSGQQTGYPYCFWGAPGLGKTSLIKTFVNIVKGTEGNSTFNCKAITLNGMKPWDFTYPVTGKTKDLDYSGKEIEKTVAIDLVKSWIPTYLPITGPNAEEENAWLDDIANGGHDIDGGHDRTKEWVPGTGGILFVDEFSRVSKQVQNVLMTLLSDLQVGHTEFKMGSKWFIVLAANRKSDMLNKGQTSDTSFENADLQRIISFNYDMTPEEWLTWATAEDRVNPITGVKEPNVIPLITKFLEMPSKQKYYYYVQKASSRDKEFGSTTIANASPRRWTLLSNVIRNVIRESDIANYNPSLESYIQGIGTKDEYDKNPEFKKLIDKQMSISAGIVERVKRVYNALKAKYPNLTFGKYTDPTDIPAADMRILVASAVGDAVADEFMEYFNNIAQFTSEMGEMVWKDPNKVNINNIALTIESCDHIVNTIVSNNPYANSSDKVPANGLLNVVIFTERLADCITNKDTKKTILGHYQSDLENAIKNKFGIQISTDDKYLDAMIRLSSITGRKSDPKNIANDPKHENQ